jgi:predicted PurR-regulated permease PerM
LAFAVFAIFIKLVSYVSEIVYSFALALLINYLFAKPVEFLTKFIRYRMVSVFLIYIFFISFFAIAIAYLIPITVMQMLALKNSLPTLVANFDMFLVTLHEILARYNINMPLEFIDRAKILNYLFSIMPKSTLPSIGSLISIVLSNSVYVIAYIVLTLIFSFYLLVDGKRAWELFLIPFSKRLQCHMKEIKHKLDDRLEAFMLGQFQIASLTASVMLITYVVLNVPFALVLGLVQLLEILPVIGTWTAFVPCLIIVSFTTSVNKGLVAFAVYMFYTQIIRDNFVAPRILGDNLGFHPLAIIISLMVGAKLGGIAGIILALPVLALITSIVDYNLELADLKVSEVAK